MINPIYKEERADPLKELLNRLQIAVGELHTASLATVPISRAGMRAGWGISKTDKAIAADAVISIAKEIKAQKGW